MITDPTWIFLIVLSIILFAPMLLERLHVPSIIGMIAAGVIIGEHGTGLLARDGSFEIFGKVGIYYIMFLAALEMNLGDVRRIWGRAVTLGLLSFAIPMLVGVACGLWILDYGAGAAFLLAAMFASHTLITYPIVLRYGLSRLRAVTMAVGGTIVADTLTLLVLAVVGGLYKGEHGQDYVIWLLVKVVGISLAIIYVFPVVTRLFFRRYGDAVRQYVFVLALVFLGAGLMQFVGMEGILGAFLVGLVLNRQIPPTSPLMTYIEFLGNALFIPYFLIGVGMIVNIGALGSIHALSVAALMVVGGVLSKFLATLSAQRLFRMTASERRLMTGLTGSRAAATLAVVLVGYGILLPDGSHLLGDDVLNGAMLMILCTCSLSSFVTEHAARGLVRSRRRYELRRRAGDDGVRGSEEEEIFGWVEPERPECLLVALSNPATAVSLTNMALFLHPKESQFPLIALNVVLDGEPEARSEGERLLAHAQKMAGAVGVRMQTFSRWSVNVVSGISHALKENSATELLLGLHQRQRLSESFLGKLGSDILSAVPLPIYIYRGELPLMLVRHIHLLVPAGAEFEPGFERWAMRIGILARQISCGIDAYGSGETLAALDAVWQARSIGVRVHLHEYAQWNNLSALAHAARKDHLTVFVFARRGSISRHAYLDRLPDQIERYFTSRPVLLLYPERLESQSPTAEALKN